MHSASYKLDMHVVELYDEVMTYVKVTNSLSRRSIINLRETYEKLMNFQVVHL